MEKTIVDYARELTDLGRSQQVGFSFLRKTSMIITDVLSRFVSNLFKSGMRSSATWQAWIRFMNDIPKYQTLWIRCPVTLKMVKSRKRWSTKYYWVASSAMWTRRKQSRPRTKGRARLSFTQRILSHLVTTL